MIKTTVYSLTMMLVISLFYSCGFVTTDQAVEFNDKIIEQQGLADSTVAVLIEAIGTFKPDQIEPALKSASLQIEKSLVELKKITNIDEESDFLALSIELLELWKSQINNEYAELLELYKLSDEEFDEEAESKQNELSKSIDDNYNVIFDKFSKSQQKFAEKHNFILEFE